MISRTKPVLFEDNLRQTSHDCNYSLVSVKVVDFGKNCLCLTSVGIHTFHTSVELMFYGKHPILLKLNVSIEMYVSEVSLNQKPFKLPIQYRDQALHHHVLANFIILERPNKEISYQVKCRVQGVMYFQRCDEPKLI